MKYMIVYSLAPENFEATRKRFAENAEPLRVSNALESGPSLVD